jgi:hypothetical protein
MSQPAGQWGPQKLAAELGTSSSLVERARDMGLIRPPDNAGRWWSDDAVKEIRGQWAGVMAAIEAARELGTVRCAELLARRTGWPVRPGDVEKMAARGLLRATRHYRQRPMYRVADVEALAADPLGRAQIADAIAAEA